MEMSYWSLQVEDQVSDQPPLSFRMHACVLLCCHQFKMFSLKSVKLKQPDVYLNILFHNLDVVSRVKALNIEDDVFDIKNIAVICRFLKRQDLKDLETQNIMLVYINTLL